MFSELLTDGKVNIARRIARLMGARVSSFDSYRDCLAKLVLLAGGDVSQWDFDRHLLAKLVLANGGSVSEKDRERDLLAKLLVLFGGTVFPKDNDTDLLRKIYIAASGGLLNFPLWIYDPQPSTLRGWYRSYVGVTESGSFVSAVQDRSGNGNDFSQSVEASRPFLSRTDNRGNALLNGENFAEAFWIKTGATVSADAATDPVGGATADKLVEDGASSEHFAMHGSSALLKNTIHTLSVYAKAAERSWIALRIRPNSGAAADKVAWFDLSNGTVGSITAGATSQIENAGNGWYCCSISADLLSGTVATPSFYFLVSTGDSTLSYAGDGTSGILIWGASLREESWQSDYLSTGTALRLFPGQDGKRFIFNRRTAAFMSTANFSLPQPATLYFLMRHHGTQVANSRILSGNTDGFIRQITLNVETLQAGSGATVLGPLTFADGEWSIVTLVLDGVNSVFQKNADAPITGDGGSGDLDGLTIGGTAAGANIANVNWLELIVRAGADSSAVRLRHQQYLASVVGITL